MGSVIDKINKEIYKAYPYWKGVKPKVSEKRTRIKKETYRRLLNNRKKQLKKYIEFSRLEEVFAGKLVTMFQKRASCRWIMSFMKRLHG